MRIGHLFLFLAIIYCSNSYCQIKNEADLKKQADKHFEDEDYNLAYKLYSQLVSLYPKDPNYNYRLGVCMLYTEPDKKKPYSYLQIANKNSNDATKEALFYLAKTYHVNYQFDEAIKLYADYKKIGSASSIKKLEVDREIQACKNGKHLLSNLSDLVIIDKKQLDEADYYRGYDVKEIGGKLLVKPDEYKSVYDKKKKDKSIVYLPKSGERLYYSSYGENGNKGRDIYFVNRLPNGGWSKAQILPSSVNTEFDEDYPFLHPNGKTLYFSSKGHNSMGGYDIFKTTYDDATQSWSKPENLEFPINSPDDDILFVTDSLEKTAFFSTGRYSPYGKLDVLKVNTERRPMNSAIIKGILVKEDANQSLKSKITVKNMDDGAIVGTFEAQDNGNYNMELPNGGKFLFTVETPGIATQSEAVNIPVAYTLKPYKQMIAYENKILKITNYFDGKVDDENYSMMIDFIEKKAKLEVNETEPYNNNLVKEAKNQSVNEEKSDLSSVSTNHPTVTNSEDNDAQKNTNKNITNEQLLEIAKTDSKEAGEDALKLKQEAQDAFGLATQKTAESVEKQKLADEAYTNANSISDTAKKNEELEKANRLKEDARIAASVANTATNMAKKLEVDAGIKQKEADLNNQYINQLETVIKNKNNNEALSKLEEIQKELDNISKQKNQSDELFSSLKAEAELKRQELANTEKKNSSLSNEINTIKNEADELQKDLANENDKTVKENISAQIRELNNEIELKNKDITTNNKKITTLQNELDGINQELLVAAKMLNESTEDIAVKNSNIISYDDNNPNNNVGSNISSNDNNQSNKDNISIENIDANNNSTITPVSNTNNNENEIKNDNVVQNNINEKNGTENSKNNTPIKLLNTESINKPEVLLNELSNLKESLTTNINTANSNTSYNKYIESTSAASKDAIVQKLEIVKQNEINLLNLISGTESSLKNSSNKNSEVLFNEADDLNNKAYELRKESATKTGEEKENLIKQATEKEKLSIEKKLQALEITQSENKAKFNNNSLNLTELQKLTNEKTSNEISQANMLIDEAVINFKQAQKMRDETDAYPSGAARLGGLSNVEEKENEALAKQEKALEILSKINPNYKIQNRNMEQANTGQSITKINEQIKKTSLSQIDAYLALSKVNQNELNGQSSKLIKETNFQNPSNKQAQELKTISDNLNKEAKTLLSQSETKQNPTEKAQLLLKANEKELAALKALNEVSELTKSNTAIANTKVDSNNNVSNNNSNATETKSVTTNDNNNKTNSDNNDVNNVTNNDNVTNNIANKNDISNIEKVTNKNIETNNNVITNNENRVNVNSNNNTENAVKDEIAKIKSDLNNPKESEILSFNPYLNQEASELKNKATEKINAAINEDKNIISSLEQLNQSVSSNGSKLNQENIAAILTEADNLNNEAFILRKNAATKTGAEKETDINNAKKLEANAVAKKIEAANKQSQLNIATYEANKQSLEELASMAKGKNISDLNSSDMLLNEAAIFFKQANDLRTEANAYPSDAAKLGGYGNAEEKENQAIAKQKNLLDLYIKHFPDYIPKKGNTSSENTDAIAKVNEVKNNLNTNNQSHIDGLSLLIQANDKEYNYRLNSLTENLSPKQNNLKTKSQKAYSQKDSIVEKANQNNDLNTKKNLLIEANKFGLEALSNLLEINSIATETIVSSNKNQSDNAISNNNINNNANKVNKTETDNNDSNNNNTDVAKNNAANNNVSANNTNDNSSNNNISTNKANTTNSNSANLTKVKVEGLEIKNNNAYSTNKPIPIDEKIPDGLVFKVQIGAFKTPLPNNTFKGLSPIIGQTTPSGYIRYMAGNFEQYNSANAVKNDLRNLGYNDAFVVAYYNGVRIPLNEAAEKAKLAGQIIEPTANASAGITANSNVPKNTITPVATSNVVTNNTIDKQPAEISNELEKMNGLLYTVQIGVYSKQVTRGQLFNLRPIYSEKLSNGLYRYTAGIYNQSNKLLEDKRKVVDLGVKDAFVSAYYNSKRIPFAEGQKLQVENNNLKMETENPIIFNDAPVSINTNSTVAANSTQKSEVTNTPTVAPFSNGITNGPTPTAENGVKTDESGISFKVQIGAYKNQVPNDVASKFLNIKTWPVKNVIINGLYIYSIGNFTSAGFAKRLKEEAISLGITDAYITVYKDGKKLYGTEATQYLTR